MIIGEPDWAGAYREYTRARDKGYMTDEQFAKLMRCMLVSEDGYVVDIGNGEVVNYVIADKFLSRIVNHKRKWKKFMVG